MRIAISTSGGDAPGLNAVIRGAVQAAHHRGVEIVGIQNGFDSLLAGGRLIDLTPLNTTGLEREGGTILGAASSGTPFHVEEDLYRLLDTLKTRKIDAVIMAGGDGTMLIADMLHREGLKVVGVPKTIDKDLTSTWTTFGFDTAVATAVEAIDKLHTTARSHSRLMVVEVMGRDTGWIALRAGLAGSANMIAIPEVPYDVDVFSQCLKAREAEGHAYHILVCAEGALETGGIGVHSARTGRYGGVGEYLASSISNRTGKESRSIALGHQLRGGAPSSFDRLLGLKFGIAAVTTLVEGSSGVMISYNPPIMREVPLSEVAGKIQKVSVDALELKVAREMGICFGETS